MNRVFLITFWIFLIAGRALAQTDLAKTLADAKRWTSNSSGEMKITQEENTLRFDVTFDGKQDMWMFPRFAFADNKNGAGLIAISFDAKTDREDNVKYAAVLIGGVYHSWKDLGTEWKRVNITFKSFDKSKARAIQIGMNPKQSGTSTLWLRNFEVKTDGKPVDPAALSPAAKTPVVMALQRHTAAWVFYDTEPLTFELKESQRGTINYHVADHTDRTVTSGVWPAEGALTLSSLPRGYYTLALESSARVYSEPLSFAVVPDVTGKPANPNSFFAVDSAQTWLCGAKSWNDRFPGAYYELISEMARRAGIQTVRDRIGWKGTESKQGQYDFKNNELNAKLLSERGIQILNLVDQTPPWARTLQDKQPDDLLALYQYGQKLGQTFSHRVVAWGYGNETDGGWICKDSRVWRTDVVRRSIQLGFQEHMDMRQEPVGWLQEDFTPDASWHIPVAVAPVGFYPWLHMAPRGTPLLANHAERFAHVAAVFTGECDAEASSTRDVYHLPQREARRSEPSLISQFSTLATGEPTVIPPTGTGCFTAVVLDPGVYRSGMMMLDIRDAAGGEIVDVVYSQGLDDNDFPVLLGTMGGTDGCREAPGDRMICRAGDQHWETFDYNGLRYVMLVFRNLHRPITVQSAGIRVIHADVPRSGHFECSDGALNAIWQAGKRTQLNCLFDTFEDCSWREQAMWWGDARIQARVTQYALGDSSILAKGIRLMTYGQAADGAMHAHPPSDMPFHFLPDFMMTWVASLHDYYWQTADTLLIAECMPALHRLMEFLNRHVADRHLIGGFDAYWVFLDWAPLFKKDYSALLNILYLEALQLATELCTLVQDPLAGRYREQADALRTALEKHFYNNDLGVWHDGYDAAAEKPVPTISQQSNAMAIMLGLKPDTHAHIAQSVLLRRAWDPACDVIESTPFFYAYVLDALTRVGLVHEAVDVIRHKWGSILPPHGADVTTFPSQWPKPGQRAMGCHAWSSSPVYHLMRLVLGIEPVTPGWREIRVTPRLGPLSYAHARIPLSGEELDVYVQNSGADIHVRVWVPANTRVQLCLDGRQWPLHSGQNNLTLERPR